MASRILPPHGASPRPPAEPSTNEVFVEDQIQKARQRVRAADLGRAALELFLLAAGYAVVMAFLDRWLQLPSVARQGAFCCFGLLAVAFVGWTILRPLSRQVNPYYAARLVERNMAASKNSLINWLDLRRQPIAPAFRSAISNQAAHDLTQVDLDTAIASGPGRWLLIPAGICVSLLLLLFVSSPQQFISLLGRAFAPFREATIVTRTRLTLLKPADGDITIPIGKALSVQVQVDGRVPDPQKPDAVRVLYRASLADPFESRPLAAEDDTRTWQTTFLATDVKTGFYYKVAGGDAETPEYRVQVRSRPLLTGVHVVYHYRPYLHWRDRLTEDPNLKDLRGTEVVLTAHTNRQVREGQLLIENSKPIQAELVRDDPGALRFHLTLERDGLYRIAFTSNEGERNKEPTPYSIRVIADLAPNVVLTAPGRDVEMAVNDVLTLEGQASDDLGLASLTLCLKKEDGKLLQPRPYRDGKTLQHGDGSYPQVLDYKDFVDFSKLQDENGTPYAPQPGQSLEYWLDATDHCDFPAPNVGQSAHWKVTFRNPQPPQEQKQRRDKAQQAQRDHEKKQDEQLQKEKNPSDASAPKEEEKPSGTEQKQDQDEQKLNEQADKLEKEINQAEEQKKGNKEEQASNKKNGQQENNSSKGNDSKAGDQGTGQKQGAEQGKNQKEKEPGKKNEPGGGKGESGSQGSESSDKQQPPGGQQPQGDGKPNAKDSQNPGNSGKQSSDGNSKDGSKGQDGNSKDSSAGTPMTDQKSGDGNSDQPKDAGKSKPGEQPNPDGSQGAKPDAKGDAQKQEGSKNGDQGNDPKNNKQDSPKGTDSKPNGGDSQKQDGSKSGDKGNDPKNTKQDSAKGADSKPSGGDPQKPDASNSGAQGNNPKDAQQDSAKGADTKPKPDPSKSAKEGKDGQKQDETGKAGQEKNQPVNEKAGSQKTGTGKEKKPGAQTAKEKPGGDPNKSKPGGDPNQPGTKQPAEDSNLDKGEKSARETLEKLKEDLRSPDPKTREKAEQELDELSKQSQDPETRKAAEQMKQEHGVNNEPRTKKGDQPAEKQGAQKDSAGKRGDKEAPKGAQSEPKGQGTKAAPNQAEPKKGNAGKDAGKPDGNSKEAPAQPGSKGAGNEKPAEPTNGDKGQTEANNGQRSNKGKSTGNTLPKKDGELVEGKGNRPDVPPTPAEKLDSQAGKHKAGDLVLDDLKKKVTDDMLKNVHMSPEEYAKFLKAYEDMLKRKQPASGKPEVTAPMRGDSGQPNREVRKVDTSAKAESKALRTGPALPPAEYRDAWGEFSKRINELEQNRDKK